MTLDKKIGFSAQRTDEGVGDIIFRSSTFFGERMGKEVKGKSLKASVSVEDALKFIRYSQVEALKKGLSVEDSLKFVYEHQVEALEAGAKVEDALKFIHYYQVEALKKGLSVEDALKFVYGLQIEALESGAKVEDALQCYTRLQGAAMDFGGFSIEVISQMTSPILNGAFFAHNLKGNTEASFFAKEPSYNNSFCSIMELVRLDQLFGCKKMSPYEHAVSEGHDLEIRVFGDYGLTEKEL